MKTKQTFQEIADGYGFEEIQQLVDGVYCCGCYSVHKRPTKMYSNGPVTFDGRPVRPGVEVLCRIQVFHLYGDRE